MNWATIAPETRIYKGHALFRWDVSPGLEHHCGICETPLHNFRAKTSCIGKHVEPCYRFHQQLHFIGRSHECFGCNHSDEMHHARHKDILILVRKITAMDDLNRPSHATSNFPSNSKSRRGSAFTTSTSTPTETSSDFAEETTKLKKTERKNARRMGLGSASTRRIVESFPKEDTDFISEAIHLSVHETKGGWEGTYVYLHKHTNPEKISDEVGGKKFLVDSTAGLSVKSSPALVDLTPRQRRCIKRLSTPVKRNTYLGGSRKFPPKGVVTDLFDGVDPQIFFRLGIEVVNPIKNSIARKDLVAKLVGTVKNDLIIIRQEDGETIMRQEGFLRWAGKAAYQAITDTRVGLDWAAGQKIGNPHIPKREFACHEEAAFVDPGDADMRDFIDAMNESGQTIEAFADDDLEVNMENHNFAVKAQVASATKENTEDSNQGWETLAAKKVVRKRRTEGGKVFRSEGKARDLPSLRIVAN